MWIKISGLYTMLCCCVFIYKDWKKCFNLACFSQVFNINLNMMQSQEDGMGTRLSRNVLKQSGNGDLDKIHLCSLSFSVLQKQRIMLMVLAWLHETASCIISTMLLLKTITLTVFVYCTYVFFISILFIVSSIN